MKEIWKDIKGYENLYQISNLGRVRSLKYNKTNESKILSMENNNGYLRCVIKGKHYRIHKLVAETFIPNFYNYPYINHIDGNKHNNNVKNLEWCTAKGNYSHALKNGFVDMHKIIMIDKKTNKIIKEFSNILELRDTIKLNRYEHIYDCCNGARKTAYGYRWEYATD